MIKLKDIDSQKLNKAADGLAKILRQVFKENFLGPEYPVVSRVKNLYIKQMMIKISKDLNSGMVKDFIRNTIEDFKRNNDFKSVKIQVDVDPIWFDLKTLSDFYIRQKKERSKRPLF